MFDDTSHPYYEPETMYSDETIQRLTILYIGATILWTIVYYYLGGFSRRHSFYIWAYFIPLVLFGISVYSLRHITTQSERILYKTNFLSIGLIIFFPLFSSIVTKYRGDTQFFIMLMVAGFVFSLISLYDVWLSPEYQPIIKHTKTILQTYTITLIVVAMYTFYINETDPDIILLNKTTPLL